MRIVHTYLLVEDEGATRMNGCDLTGHLEPPRPSMKVSYTSGCADDAVAQPGALDAGVGLLGKPLTPDALVSKVRELLGLSQEGR